MGAILSASNSRAFEVSQNETRKRQKCLSSSSDENLRLIPSLPDEISIQILARVPRIYYFNVKLVSQSWRAAVTSSELFNVRKELGTTEEWLYLLTKAENKIFWYALDPLHRRWQRLPPMPMVSFEDESKKGLAAALRMWNAMGSSVKIPDAIKCWFGRKDALDRMSFCGCSIGAVDGCLYVLGGFARALAMRHVWRYDPIQNAWSEASPMSVGRAFSKTGILNDKLYAVGGVTRGRTGLTPLLSAEVYDPHTGVWSEIPSMPFFKTPALPTTFLADLLKPMATGMTSYKGKLFVSQSLYCWPFFVDVGGEVYDPGENSWAEMPAGMSEGWPVRQAGTKLSITVEDELYALEPSREYDSASIKVYDHQDDTWKVVLEDVPIPNISDSEAPYLLANLLGKLHVVTKDVDDRIIVLQAEVHNHFTSSALLTDDSEFNPWKTVVTRIAGTAELVGCQTLNI